jgi:hypothetical protein
MKLTPYRFRLPVIGMALTALLIFLKNSFDTLFFDILLIICDLINWPAMLIYQYLAMFAEIRVWGIHSSYNLGLCLALVGLWWYFVGLELDFDLLRRAAKKNTCLEDLLADRRRRSSGYGDLHPLWDGEGDVTPSSILPCNLAFWLFSGCPSAADRS